MFSSPTENLDKHKGFELWNGLAFSVTHTAVQFVELKITCVSSSMLVDCYSRQLHIQHVSRTVDRHVSCSLLQINNRPTWGGTKVYLHWLVYWIIGWCIYLFVTHPTAQAPITRRLGNDSGLKRFALLWLMPRSIYRLAKKNCQAVFSAYQLYENGPRPEAFELGWNAGKEIIEQTWAKFDVAVDTKKNVCSSIFCLKWCVFLYQCFTGINPVHWPPLPRSNNGNVYVPPTTNSQPMVALRCPQCEGAVFGFREVTFVMQDVFPMNIWKMKHGSDALIFKNLNTGQEWYLNWHTAFFIRLTCSRFVAEYGLASWLHCVWYRYRCVDDGALCWQYVTNTERGSVTDQDSSPLISDQW